jgi:MFS transporter, DHA1 family, tetracycline resistance protein
MKNLFKNKLFIIIFTIFLDSLGFGILIPVIPLLLADPASPSYLLPPGVSVQTGYILLGLITAIFPLMQLFSTTIFGQLSDKFGRKPIVLYTLFGTAASYFLFALGIAIKNIPLLFASRALAGITSGNLSVAQAAIADITDPKHRVKNFGLIGAAFGLGFILGPFLGGKLSDPHVLPFFNPTVPFIFAGLLSLYNAVSVKMFFSETNKHIDPHAVLNWGKSLSNITKAFQLKDIRFLYLVNFLFFSGFTFFITFFSIFLIHRFHFSPGAIGDFFSFIGIWIVITQGFITRKVAKYVDATKVLRFTIILDGIFIGLLYFAPHAWVLYLINPFIAIFNGLSFANMAGLISRSVDGKVQGEILGINASVQALAQLIPPILSGFIAAQFAPEAPLIAAAVMIIFAGILYNLFYKPAPRPEHIPGY